MAQTREKALTYRRAEWLDDIPKGTTLESCLSDAHKKLKTVQARTFTRDSGQCIRWARKLEPRDGGIFLHVTADTPGDKASVVRKVARGAEEAEVSTANAPADAEFMDGDAFLYVKGDHVCLCSTGLRDGAVRAALYDLFEKAELGDFATHFDLLKVANVNKIKMLHAQGVKEIVLRATMYQATAQYEKRKANTSGVLGGVARQIRAIVKAEDEEFDDSLRVTISIKSDERFRKHLGLGEKRLEQLATDVVENEENYDDYLIITESGQKIAPQEIYVKEIMYIEALGKSVKYNKAWDHLEKFYKRLRKAGMLEQ